MMIKNQFRPMTMITINASNDEDDDENIVEDYNGDRKPIEAD